MTKRCVVKFVALFALFALVCLSFSSCFLRLDEDSSVYQNTVKITDAIIANDIETAYSVVDDVIGRADFETAFSKMHALLEGVSEYSLKVSEWSRGIDDGVSYTRAYIVIESNAGNFMLKVQEVGGYEGLVTYNISPIAAEEIVRVNTPVGLVIGAVAYNVVELGIVIFALVDCLKHSKRSKLLMSILIVLGRVVFRATVSAQKVNTFVGLFLGLSSVEMGVGGFEFAIMLPIAAIAWFFVRKKMCTPDPNVVPMPKFDEPEDNKNSEEDLTDGENA